MYPARFRDVVSHLDLTIRWSTSDRNGTTYTRLTCSDPQIVDALQDESHCLPQGVQDGMLGLKFRLLGDVLVFPQVFDPRPATPECGDLKFDGT